MVSTRIVAVLVLCASVSFGATFWDHTGGEFGKYSGGDVAVYSSQSSYSARNRPKYIVGGTLRAAWMTDAVETSDPGLDPIPVAAQKPGLEAEIDSKTLTLISQSFTVNKGGTLYTLSTRQADQDNMAMIVDNYQLGTLSLPQKVRLASMVAGSLSLELENLAQLKAYVQRFREHIRMNQEAGWTLKEQVEAATTQGQIDSIRAANNAR